MLEDLFKVVTTRFNGNNEKTDKKPSANLSRIPDDLLFKCPRCQNVVFEDEIKAMNMVCPSCGYHGRLTAGERIAVTLDKGSFCEFDSKMRSKNPIGFPGYDSKSVKGLFHNLL